MGKPVVFLRLAGCNLNCEWCDSKYTWDNGKEMTLAEVERKMIGFCCDGLVITGGEPMLQDEAILELVKTVTPLHIDIELETNGTIEPTSIEFASYIDHITVSPKLHQPINGSAINYFRVFNTDFKFVVRDKTDLSVVNDFCDKFNIDHNNVFLMPLTEVGYDYRLEDDNWIVEYCKEMGYNYSPRLQIALWGFERGK